MPSPHELHMRLVPMAGVAEEGLQLLARPMEDRVEEGLLSAAAAAGRTMEEVAELRVEVAGGWALQAEPWAEPQAAVAMG